MKLNLIFELGPKVLEFEKNCPKQFSNVKTKTKGIFKREEFHQHGLATKAPSLFFLAMENSHILKMVIMLS